MARSFFSPPITETARGRASSIAKDGRDQEAVRSPSRPSFYLFSCFVSRAPPFYLRNFAWVIWARFSLIAAYAFRAFSRHTTAHLSHMRPPASTPCPVFIWVSPRETPGVLIPSLDWIRPRIRSRLSFACCVLWIRNRRLPYRVGFRNAEEAWRAMIPRARS